MKRQLIAFELATAAVAAAAPAAGAATAQINNGTLAVVGGPGEANSIKVTLPTGGKFKITDPGAPLSVGANCESVDAHTATCGGAVTSVSLSGGDLDDRLDTSVALPASVGGGSGNDALFGGPAAATLNGGSDDDVLDGRGGPDSLVGGAGSGDRADYSARTSPVTVSIDGVANDGVRLEQDNVSSSVEQLLGGAGRDHLTGSEDPEQLDGGPGDDTLDGGLGADVLRGGADADTVSYAFRRSELVIRLVDSGSLDFAGAEGENDSIAADIENATGGARLDVITGNLGTNVLDGGAGNDFMRGLGGDDTLDGALGADTMIGDGGIDTVTYANRTLPVNVRIDTAALDGEFDPLVEFDTEGDFVHPTVENLVGGSAGDQLFGDADANRIDGGPDSDFIQGIAGADTLLGSDGSDNIEGGDGTDTIEGGDGFDNLRGDADPDTLDGGADNDSLRGDGGDDVLRGEDGNDRLEGGLNTDQLLGGAGVDTASYGSALTGVTASLDTLANDGEAGEQENIGGAGDDIENIDGSFQGDVLCGNAGPTSSTAAAATTSSMAASAKTSCSAPQATTCCRASTGSPTRSTAGPEPRTTPRSTPASTPSSAANSRTQGAPQRPLGRSAHWQASHSSPLRIASIEHATASGTSARDGRLLDRRGAERAQVVGGLEPGVPGAAVHVAHRLQVRARRGRGSATATGRSTSGGGRRRRSATRARSGTPCGSARAARPGSPAISRRGRRRSTSARSASSRVPQPARLEVARRGTG